MNHRIRYFLLISFTVAYFVNAYSEIMPKKLVFATILHDSPESKFAITAYNEIGQRMGIAFEFKNYPLKRASILANRGDVDGEPGRVAGYEKQYPNMIKINVPILEIKYCLYSHNKTLKIVTLEELKEKSYTVEYLSGTLAITKLLSKFVKKENLSSVSTIENGLMKVVKKRSDLYFGVDFTTQNCIKNEFSNENIYNIGTVFSHPVYTYLHKKHTLFAPKLEKVLKKMQKDGSLNKIQNKFFNAL